MAMATKPKPKFKAFWTIQGIAEHLDVSQRTVRRWIASGELVAHKLGRAVRVSDSDLRDFLARHRNGG